MKITADDYGLDIKENKDIISAYQKGLVNSICILPNGNYFNDAIRKMNELKDAKIDIHLNISEGKAVSNKKLKFLTDINNNFTIGFIKAMFLSFNKNFLCEVYDEYKAQIEYSINKGINPYSLNSHIHLHAIPNIFKIVCELAKEYNIKIVRTNYEKFYIVNDFKLIFNFKFFVNIIKNLVLKIFTLINLQTLKKYNLNTNKYLIGILYTSMMSKKAIEKGIEVCNGVDNIEVILHFIPKNLEYSKLFS